MTGIQLEEKGGLIFFFSHCNIGLVATKLNQHSLSKLASLRVIYASMKRGSFPLPTETPSLRHEKQPFLCLNFGPAANLPVDITTLLPFKQKIKIERNKK